VGKDHESKDKMPSWARSPSPHGRVGTLFRRGTLSCLSHVAVPSWSGRNTQ
jgi:hypothetical protein